MVSINHYHPTLCHVSLLETVPGTYFLEFCKDSAVAHSMVPLNREELERLRKEIDRVLS